MIAVVNATPLIALSLLEGLDLLRELFGQVVVPPLVYHEVAVQGRGRPGAAVVRDVPPHSTVVSVPAWRIGGQALERETCGRANVQPVPSSIVCRPSWKRVAP